MLEPSGDQVRLERRFKFQDNVGSVDYSETGSALPPARTSRYHGVYYRNWTKKPHGRNLSDVLRHDLKVQAHSPRIAASDHKSTLVLPEDISDEDLQEQYVV